MNLDVYYCRDGSLLLVPDCFMPSLRAQHRYGHLRAAGSFAVEPGPRWTDLFDEIDRRSFARIVDARMAQDLLSSGAFHPNTSADGAEPAEVRSSP